MKRISKIALCLVAAFATSAAMAASASAIGEFGKCEALTGGKYATSACDTEKAGTLKYEWYPATSGKAKKLPEKLGFTSENEAGKAIQLEATGEKSGTHTVTKCLTETSKGTVTSPTKAQITATLFTGCETNTKKCHSEGKGEGEISVENVIAEPGLEAYGNFKEGTGKYRIEPSKDKLALELTPENEKEIEYEHKVGEIVKEKVLLFAQFECSGINLFVRGHVLVPATTNKMVASAKVKFAATKGSQKPEAFGEKFNTVNGKTEFEIETKTNEHGVSEKDAKKEIKLESFYSNLKVFGFEEAGQTLTSIQKNEESIELNSVA